MAGTRPKRLPMQILSSNANQLPIQLGYSQEAALLIASAPSRAPLTLPHDSQITSVFRFAFEQTFDLTIKILILAILLLLIFLLLFTVFNDLLHNLLQFVLKRHSIVNGLDLVVLHKGVRQADVQ